MCHHNSQFLALVLGICCSSLWPTWFAQGTGNISTCSRTVLNVEIVGYKGKSASRAVFVLLRTLECPKVIFIICVPLWDPHFGSKTKAPVKVHVPLRPKSFGVQERIRNGGSLGCGCEKESLSRYAQIWFCIFQSPSLPLKLHGLCIICFLFERGCHKSISCW